MFRDGINCSRSHDNRHVAIAQVFAQQGFDVWQVAAVYDLVGRVREAGALRDGGYEVAGVDEAGILFATGVDVGQDDDIRALKGGHEVVEERSGAGEHVGLVGQYDAASRETLARGGQGERDGGGMMGVIVDQHDIVRFSMHIQLALVTYLEASFHSFKLLQRVQRGVERNFGGMGGGQSC